MDDSWQGCNLYWGDIHNHNAVGYAVGSLERSIAIAKEHLDFFAFTGHASWHDIPQMPGERHMKWVNGFKVHTDHWPKTRQLIKAANSSSFVSLLGYEWHSSRYGDYCMVFPEDQPDLFLPDNVSELLSFAKNKGAFAIPHHVAYKEGCRGANWSYFDPAVTPVVEIFSEHGCTESDRAPYPMILHSIGGRSTSNTVQNQLSNGLRFGFVASTDDHFGYPGAYGEGVAGVWARDLTPAEIFEAIRARRTYAITGDRIGLQFALNGHPMGAELPAVPVREIQVSVDGGDALHMVELIRNGRVVKRHFPEDHLSPTDGVPRRGKIRIQYGWGPWAALDLARVCRWEMKIAVRNGRLLDVEPCFQSGPYEEDLRDRVRQISDTEIELSSFTSRRDAYLLDPTKSIICEIEMEPKAHLEIILTAPTEMRRDLPLSQLVSDNDITFTGGFTTESVMVHRIVREEDHKAAIEWEDRSNETGTGDLYYVRVRQHNGHLAWSSPIWVG